MKFRLWTILWVFALFASGMATFGGTAFLLPTLVVAGWSIRFAETRELLVLLTVFLSAIGLVFTCAQYVDLARRHHSCANNMKQLGLGLLNYESVNGTFPASAEAAPGSKYKQSWRLWIYPFLESSTFFEQFRKDEAWNSPSNSQLVKAIRLDWLFHCQAHPSSGRESHYLAVVGDRAAFPPNRGRSLTEFTDGTSKTVTMIEAPHMHVGWAEPRDLTMEEAMEFLSNPSNSNDYGHPMSEGFFYKPSRGVHVATADAWTRLLKLPISEKHAEAILTVDGGEVVDWNDIPMSRLPELDYARIYSFSVFVVLSLLPAIKLRKKQPSDAEPGT